MARLLTAAFLVLCIGNPTLATEAKWLSGGVTAHRGDSASFPENTMPAFESAIRKGADWIELDAVRTADGQIVIIHDQTTGRTCSKDLKVTESTYAELTALDMAERFREKRGLSLAECPRQTIPKLEELLRLIKTQQKTRVSIQPKSNCVADIVKIVDRLDAGAWVGFNDGNLKYMVEAKTGVPEATIFWDRYRSDIDADIKVAKKNQFDALILNRDDVSPEAIDKIQAAGLKVGAWTVNDRPTIEKFLRWGIDRIYTDNPSLLKRVQAETGN
jgi:glycerophosphoryl diester phosphodiesterase